VSGTVIGGTDNPNAPSGLTSLSEPILRPIYEQGDETGFELYITPSVGVDHRSVTLIIEPSIRDHVRTLSSPIEIASVGIEGESKTQEVVVERPVISERALLTKMVVHDGHWVMIGGLVRVSQEERVTKVPILGDIPLISYFFRRETTVEEKRNLLIFARAKVISPRGETYVDVVDLRPKEETGLTEQPDASGMDLLLRGGVTR